MALSSLSSRLSIRYKPASSGGDSAWYISTSPKSYLSSSLLSTLLYNTLSLSINHTMVGNFRDINNEESAAAAAANNIIMDEEQPEQQSEQFEDMQLEQQYDDNSEAVNQRYEERCVNIDNMLNEEWQRELRRQREDEEREQREEREAAEQAEQQQQQRDRQQRQQRKLKTLHTRHNVTVKLQRIMSDYMNTMLIRNRRIIEDLQHETLQNYTPNDDTYSPVRCRSPNLFSEDDDDDNDNDANKGDTVINTISNAFKTYFDNDSDNDADNDDTDNDDDEPAAEPDAEPADELEPAAELATDAPVDADEPVDANELATEPEPAEPADEFVSNSAAEPIMSPISDSPMPPVSDFVVNDTLDTDSDDSDDLDEYFSKKQFYIRKFINFFQIHQDVILANYINRSSNLLINVGFYIKHYTCDLGLMRGMWEDMFEFSGLDVNVENIKLAHHYWNSIFDDLFTRNFNANDSLKQIYDSIIKQMMCKIAAYSLIYNSKSFKIIREIQKEVSCILNRITIDDQESCILNPIAESESEDEDALNLWLESSDSEPEPEPEPERPQTPPPSYDAAMAVADAATTSIKVIRRERRLALRRERANNSQTDDSQTGSQSYSPML
ncbi:hypothetical protein [Spodoptera cosmioides nucleopolyhedrovirus]|uniref:Uncharacterized protein n=1 Tax=Spodoptera cosmioides nucleopolyhedrovirus TaxID=2605774 RepID=A0A6B7KKN2_9ABAC|nr:hypothetical protein [Spodoptera cosmioides nucleopolyhedrovirus]